MKRTSPFKKILLILLIAVSAFSIIACSAEKKSEPSTPKAFTFEVYLKDKDIPEKTIIIETTKQTLEEALLDEGLIEGEKSSLGLYVKKVCGIVADYDIDGTYWALYIGENISPKGASSVDVENGTVYSFRIE